MTDRPTIFTGPMVRAILDDRKTQDRRVLKAPADAVGFVIRNGRCDWVLSVGFQQGQKLRFQPGDLLWVQETWAKRADFDVSGWCAYKAGPAPLDVKNDLCRWRSPTHMPRWASRITLRVTDVRVQRVQEISEADIRAEGLLTQEGDGSGPGPRYSWDGTGFHGAGSDRYGPTFHTSRPGERRCSCHAAGPTPAQCAYAEWWNSIHAKRPERQWAANPWVAVVTFERVRA